MVELAGTDDEELATAEIEPTREEEEEEGEEEGTLVDETVDDAEEATRFGDEEIDEDDREMEEIWDDTSEEDEGSEMEELGGRTEDIPSVVVLAEEEDGCVVELDCAGVVEVVEGEAEGVVVELDAGGVVVEELDCCWFELVVSSCRVDVSAPVAVVETGT